MHLLFELQFQISLIKFVANAEGSHNHKINFNEPGKEITVVTRWAWDHP